MFSTEVIIGSCSTDDNPDNWFPENFQGRPSQAKKMKLVEEVKHAISICESCPSKDRCLAEGMKEDNLAYGIWGGKLAGQRLSSLGYVRENFQPNSDEGNAMDFSMRMEPWLEW